MFECLILGDSIGVGTATALVARHAIHCDVMAVERVRAGQIFGLAKARQALSYIHFGHRFKRSSRDEARRRSRQDKGIYHNKTRNLVAALFTRNGAVGKFSRRSLWRRVHRS